MKSFCVCFRMRRRTAPLRFTPAMTRDEAAKHVALLALRGYIAYAIYAL